jgi:hypothetical protein
LKASIIRKTALAVGVALVVAQPAQALYTIDGMGNLSGGGDFGTVMEGGAIWDGAIFYGSGALADAQNTANSTPAGSITVGAATDYRGEAEPYVQSNPWVSSQPSQSIGAWGGELGNGTPLGADPCAGRPDAICIKGKREVTVDLSMSFNPWVSYELQTWYWQHPETWGPAWGVYTEHTDACAEAGICAPEDPKPTQDAKQKCITTCNTAQALANDAIDIAAAKWMFAGNAVAIAAGAGAAGATIIAKAGVRTGLYTGFAVYGAVMVGANAYTGNMVAQGKAAAAQQHTICLKTTCGVSNEHGR